MARDGNTYAKRQRETLKRQKAAEKRERRQKRKEQPEAPPLVAADRDDAQRSRNAQLRRCCPPNRGWCLTDEPVPRLAEKLAIGLCGRKMEIQ